jgi:hypothetical protein
VENSPEDLELYQDVGFLELIMTRTLCILLNAEIHEFRYVHLECTVMKRRKLKEIQVYQNLYVRNCSV